MCPRGLTQGRFTHGEGDGHCEFTGLATSAQQRLTAHLSLETATMPPSLPQEILDLVVDHLCDERMTLNTCCSVSKSWVPRTRRHLFFRIEFSPLSPIESWMKAFPDPSNSPSRCVRVLSLHGSPVVASVGTYARAWVQTFRHIVELRMLEVWWDDSLVPLHGLSPILSSLSIRRSYIPPPELINLICSFPLLKDLQLDPLSANDSTVADEWSAPSTSPELTGSLHLSGEIRSVIPRLLDLSNCFQFAEVEMMCTIDDADLAANLVMKCSKTLESLFIGYFPTSMCLFASVVSPKYLTAAHGPRLTLGATSVRLIQSHKTKRLGIQTAHPGCSVDHRDDSNCQEPPADHHSLACLLRGRDCGNSPSRVARPRPPVGPIVDLSFNPSRD
jgi:hypothetical protein